MFEKLFSPITIRGMELKNRVMLPAMGTKFAGKASYVTDQLIDYHVARVKGGCGLNMVEVCSVHTPSAPRGFLSISEDEYVPGLKKLTDAIHAEGGKAGIQLWQGSMAVGMDQTAQILMASDMPMGPGITLPGITVEQIKEVVACYGKAAKRAAEAGFDCIEFHCAHNYLPHSFLSGGINHRTDEYGGSWENRTRFATEIVESIRNVVGPNFPIIFRISLDHMFKGGRTLEDSMPIIELLEKAGVDAFDIDSGCYETMDYIFPTCYTGEACMAYVCEEARKHVSVPIINAGNHSMETAVDLLESGNADIISFGRQLIADPQFPNKLKAGHREDVRPCIICNEECIGRIFGRLTQLSCTVNPNTGFETHMEVTKLAEEKKVVVIGAGPGGLEAARTAAIRGCKVTIYEATDIIGGTFERIASPSFKKRIRELIKWYGVQLDKLGVEIKLNTKVGLDDPCLVNADEIFVATGSVPFVPNIEGKDNKKVIDVTAAHVNGVEGQKVVICGGGLSGCDTALELAMQDKDVTIVEMLDACARDVMPINKISLDRMLAEYKVNILTSTKVVGITDEGVKVEKADGTTEVIPADNVITAFGQRPNHTLADAIADKYPLKTTLIGDCQKTSKAGNAIREGYYAAMALQ